MRFSKTLKHILAPSTLRNLQDDIREALSNDAEFQKDTFKAKRKRAELQETLHELGAK